MTESLELEAFVVDISSKACMRRDKAAVNGVDIPDGTHVSRHLSPSTEHTGRIAPHIYGVILRVGTERHHDRLILLQRLPPVQTPPAHGTLARHARWPRGLGCGLLRAGLRRRVCGCGGGHAGMLQASWSWRSGGIRAGATPHLGGRRALPDGLGSSAPGFPRPLPHVGRGPCR